MTAWFLPVLHQRERTGCPGPGLLLLKFETSGPLLTENDWVPRTLMPEPSIVPDMRRNEIMGDAVSAASGHLEGHTDVLVGTRVFLCLDIHTESST